MKKLLALACLSALLQSCKKSKEETVPGYLSISEQGAELPYTVLKTLNNGTEINNGGFGSAASKHPFNSNEFYALTDRGANTKIPGGKVFLTPDYSPKIGHFMINGDGSVLELNTIQLKTPSGTPITGLPNPQGLGATGEIPYNLNQEVLSYDEYGLDPEGLVAMNDGTFWISDEYGPHIVHLNSNGVELERISPVGINTGERKLPAVFKTRRPNRGMEGLGITANGKTLVGIMQSTLYNPSKSDIINKSLTRILTFNIQTGETAQYLYKQDAKFNSNSEIVGLSETEFLVIERDGKFLGESGSVQKKIYKIDISQATDVSGAFNAVNGLMVDGKTLEQNTWEELKDNNIEPVTKELVSDLVLELNYPHDKLEGLWMIGDHKLGILNDDDFGVTTNDEGEVVSKILPQTQMVDKGTLYVIGF